MRDDWGSVGQSGVSHPTGGWAPISFVSDIYRLPTWMSDIENDLVGTGILPVLRRQVRCLFYRSGAGALCEPAKHGDKL